ncbi:hypothetical protein C2G38_2033898 [Gigaspora rosea]|uniref:Protein kinase domain-containing protein n=1 Tax=Gigaspora rosea TaxID=44941 RepID=A0A397VQ77_9GLOM|nr:hypothetical protein C2G38_2033898 [Gigaspora rosea]
MQYADSGTLKKYLKDYYVLELDQKISLCKDIVKGLEFLHKENIIHRDLVENNIHPTEPSCHSGPKIIIKDTDKMQDVSPTNKMQLHLSQHDFEPLFNEVYKLEEIRKSNESNDSVQLNKIMYKVLSQCILEAKYHVKRIHVRKSYLSKFVTLENYTYFKNLVDNLKGINKFMENISHIKGLKSFIQNIDSRISCKLLKTEYSKLLEEYHKSMSSLGFIIQKDKKMIRLWIMMLKKQRRSENIMITSNLRAKIINFCHSRLTKDHSKQLKQLQIECTGIKYVAPEIIERNTYTHTQHTNSYTASTLKYNFKCEIYSFGILLWELANQKPPYEDENDYKDLNKIINFIRQNKKNFNNSVTKKYAEISIKATNGVPIKCPTICDMHKVLYKLEKYFGDKNY